MIDFHLAPEQKHRVIAERTHAPLSPIEPLILRPRESFAMVAVMIVQSAAPDALDGLPEGPVAKLRFQFVKPVNECLNMRHVFPFVAIQHIRTEAVSAQGRGESSDRPVARCLAFASR